MTYYTSFVKVGYNSFNFTVAFFAIYVEWCGQIKRAMQWYRDVDGAYLLHAFVDDSRPQRLGIALCVMFVCSYIGIVTIIRETGFM